MIKEHYKKYKTLYLCTATGVVIAGFTYLIMRGRYEGLGNAGPYGPKTIDTSVTMRPIRDSKCISRAIGVTAGRDIVVTKKSILNNVSYISSNRKGAPSWVIRCVETGIIFTSQHSAALSMELSESHISAHLNGIRDNVNGYTFERICMAA